jgi:hypothetical protein
MLCARMRNCCQQLSSTDVRGCRGKGNVLTDCKLVLDVVPECFPFGTKLLLVGSDRCARTYASVFNISNSSPLEQVGAINQAINKACQKLSLQVPQYPTVSHQAASVQRPWHASAACSSREHPANPWQLCTCRIGSRIAALLLQDGLMHA